MNKLITGFVHRAGVHCESTALRDIFEFYGFPFSEAMVFGLGSGLGFVYWHSKQMPYPFVGGRARDFDMNLCTNLGVTVNVNKTSSRTRAYESLKALINQNVPVMVHVDMPYLKYLQLPERAHFGGHTVVVAGINENKGIIYIADTMFTSLQTASLKELEQARSSIFKPFAPENKWLTFRFPEKLNPIEAAIENAITKTAKDLFNPPIKNLGVRGIDYFANELVKWPKLFPLGNPLFRELYEVQYVMMEEDGTGGGLFRYLYSKFLKEAGERLNNTNLKEIGERYHKIGQKWTRIAKLILQTPTNPENIHEASQALHEVAEEETTTLKSLVSTFS